MLKTKAKQIVMNLPLSGDDEESVNIYVYTYKSASVETGTAVFQ